MVVGNFRKEIEEWIAVPFNEDFVFQRPLAVLKAFVASSESPPNWGAVLEALGSWSTWYRSRGVLDVLDGGTHKHLCEAFWSDYLYNLIMRSSFREELKKAKIRSSFLGRFTASTQPRPRISLNDHGLLVAQAFALGLITQAEELGQSLVEGLRDGYFYGFDTRLTPFVLEAYSRWQSDPSPSVEGLCALPAEYDELLRTLTFTSEEFPRAIFKACDFHLSRSKENTDDETFEFWEQGYAIYPVEILMVMRIRELLGLKNPVSDHPLLASPLGKLATESYPMNSIQKDVFDKVSKSV